jgi:protein-tyrosine-phosphatase
VPVESIDLELLRSRALLHAGLGDPYRLAIIDQLVLSDRAPSELAAVLGIESNLVAHHLGVLESLNLVARVVSGGDRRRRYVQLVPSTLAQLGVGNRLRVGRLVFVCTENVARSQLAALFWNHLDTGVLATSGGTRPGHRVHPGAVRAARRRGLDLRNARPGPIPDLGAVDLIVTVCDKAHETARRRTMDEGLHWSVPDPLALDDPEAFELTAEILARRVQDLSSRVLPIRDTEVIGTS